MIYKCQSCGGNVVYDPGLRKMHCPYCDGIGTHLREECRGMEVCQNCGAPVDAGDYRSAVKCEYCGHYNIFEERIEKEYQPRFILPFRLGKKDAVEKIMKKCGSRLFMPETFLSEASLEKMEGSYVPFWLYDMTADCRYNGTGTKKRVWVSGDTEYTETSYYQVIREMEADFEKLPVDASIAMNDKIMDLMEPYQYEELTDFNPEYMSGFLAEVYNQPAEELGDRANEKVRADAKVMLHRTMNEYATLTPLEGNIYLKNRVEDYALLPVWWYRYRYRDKDYDFFVNGQTGKVVGKMPLSGLRALAYSGTFFACVTTILMLIRAILER
ncbi:MAG: hypothetical protein Q4C58_01045 [Eubacteriales bacterium]|nr:hypothetical protein [Eubacteriales bacterium]